VSRCPWQLGHIHIQWHPETVSQNPTSIQLKTANPDVIKCWPFARRNSRCKDSLGEAVSYLYRICKRWLAVQFYYVLINHFYCWIWNVLGGFSLFTLQHSNFQYEVSGLTGNNIVTWITQYVTIPSRIIQSFSSQISVTTQQFL